MDKEKTIAAFRALEKEADDAVRETLSLEDLLFSYMANDCAYFLEEDEDNAIKNIDDVILRAEKALREAVHEAFHDINVNLRHDLTQKLETL